MAIPRTVKTQYYTYQEKLKLESGSKLGPITIAYETYGTLNTDKNNVILIEHAFSGDAHAAGYHEGDKIPGWWDKMIGPGLAFDTNKYFVICSNVLGGCGGTTGPSSINPETGKHYGTYFPLITISDMVEAQKLLLDSLGIEKIFCVAGGSMGGMQALQWVALYPEKVQHAAIIASSLKHSPQNIAFDEVGRQAVMADPEWRGGNYYDSTGPEKGLAVARMLGHITYMSQESMEKKFSRRLKNDNYTFSFKVDFEVESYLRYRGESFIKRFDPNSYLYISKAMDYFDLSGNALLGKDKKIDTRFLVIAFKSDWLFPPEESEGIVRALKRNYVNATYVEINSHYGHDAFLIEFDDQTHLIKNFLMGNRNETGLQYNI